MPRPRPSRTRTESLGRRIFLACVGTPLLLGAAAFSTCGSADQYFRREKPAAREGNGHATIYKTENNLWTVTYAGHGVLPDAHFTSADRGVLEAAVLYAQWTAAEQLNSKGSIQDRVVQEKAILRSLANKALHITEKTARGAGVELSDYMKPCYKVEIPE